MKNLKKTIVLSIGLVIATVAIARTIYGECSCNPNFITEAMAAIRDAISENSVRRMKEGYLVKIKNPDTGQEATYMYTRFGHYVLVKPSKAGEQSLSDMPGGSENIGIITITAIPSYNTLNSSNFSTTGSFVRGRGNQPNTSVEEL